MPSSRRALTPIERRIDAWAHARLARLSDASGPRRAAIEFVVFVLKQAWACVFGALMLAALVAARLWYPDDAAIARSDALVIAAVGIQAAMLLFRLESLREAGAILLFHVVGTAMEVFKTDVGSWAYEGDGLLRIGGVPLYTGFMYAAVGSYMMRVFRLFELRFERYPPLGATVALAAAVYVNFFSHHFLPDARWILVAAVVLLYARCTMSFRNHADRAVRRMPILVAFTGVAFFLWIAENIGTAAGAWIYPSQEDGWHPVSLSKLVSWFLLMMISVVLVTVVSRPEPPSSSGDAIGAGGARRG